MGVSLAERLQEQTDQRGGRPCPVGELRHTLSESDWDALTASLFGDGVPRLSSPAIARALTQEGLLVPQPALDRHRKKVCRCWLTA